MERLNSSGKKILEYQQEFNNAHSDIVKSALVTSLELLLQQNIITKDVLDCIKAEESESALKLILLQNPQYKKKPKELFKEYEKIRISFENKLKEAGLPEIFETESSIEFNRITVLRQYSVDKDFIMLYFGLKEVDLIQLMKKRGFAEKFSVLRINQVFDEVAKEMRPEENIVQGYSLVYYNPDITGFSIDYKYHVNVDFLEDETNVPNIVKKIIEMDRSVERKYRRKIGLEFYMPKDPKKIKNPAIQVSTQTTQTPQVKNEASIESKDTPNSMPKEKLVKEVKTEEPPLLPEVGDIDIGEVDFSGGIDKIEEPKTLDEPVDDFLD